MAASARGIGDEERFTAKSPPLDHCNVKPLRGGMRRTPDFTRYGGTFQPRRASRFDMRGRPSRPELRVGRGKSGVVDNCGFRRIRWDLNSVAA